MALTDNNDTQPLQVPGVNAGQPNPDSTIPLQVPGANGTPAANVPPTTAPTPQVSPQVSAAPNVATPAAPTAPTAPALPSHTDLFSGFLKNLAGPGNGMAPVRDPQGRPVVDPDTGEVQRQPMSRKMLGASILAGALSALAAGMTEQPRYMGREQGYQGANVGAAAQKGMEAAAQQTPQARLAGAQKEADDMKLRQYSTAKLNYDIHQQAVAFQRMKDEDLQRSIDAFAGQSEALQAEGLTWKNPKTGQDQPLVVGTNMNSADIQKAMNESGDTLLMKTAIPTSFHKVYDNNGKFIGNEVLYTVFHSSNDGQIPITDRLKADFPLLTNATGNISVQALTKLSQTKSQDNISSSAWSNFQKLVKDNDPKVTVPSYTDFIKQHPELRSKIADIGHAASQGQLDAILNNADSVQGLGSAMRAAAGFPDTAQIAEDRKIKNEAALTRAKEQADKKTPEQLAYDVANYPAGDPKHDAAVKTLAEQTAQRGRDAAAEAANRMPAELRKQAQEQALKSGSPEDAGRLLANHSLSLTELKTRGMTPSFIAQATKAAQKIDPTYNPQKSDADYNVAKSNENTKFFGNTNSLLAAGGTLDQLQSQYNKLGNTQIPLFNKWKDYAAYQTGDEALAGFMQTAIGVADDYAKVMGGGTGTDTSRLQIMQSFSNAHNPAQMKAAIDAAKAAVRSQRDGRIGKNETLQAMYGEWGVDLPNGGKVYFQSKEAAAQFKQKAGLK